MFKQNHSALVLAGYVLVVFILFAGQAWASTAGPGGGTGVQWEQPMQMLVRSLSGPIAYGFLVIGLVVLGFKLVMGGDFGDIARGVMNFVIAGSFIAFATGIIGGVMFSGALVPVDVILTLQ